MGWVRGDMEWELEHKGREQDGREQVLDDRERHDVHDVQVHDAGHDDRILLSTGIDLF